ncbi:unnamed protein product [Symbiodinium sp. KB8]|nr:unnamed protein product [Symbiodinium sp. KB8]
MLRTDLITGVGLLGVFSHFFADANKCFSFHTRGGNQRLLSKLCVQTSIGGQFTHAVDAKNLYGYAGNAFDGDPSKREVQICGGCGCCIFLIGLIMLFGPTESHFYHGLVY